jgi:HAD superfamily hydrolase (TIGR01509 family)
MIKLIIFDLDGVLVSSKELHYEALNKALSDIDPEYQITYNEHIGKYDGLSTRKKLEKLSDEKGLLELYHDKIWENKQTETLRLIQSFTPDERIITVLKSISSKYKIACCTNSIRETATLQLQKKGFYNFLTKLYTNEDVKHTKPNAEIYMRCMLDFEVNPDETLIIEDSFIGRRAAQRSGAHVLPVNSPDDLTIESIQSFIMNLEKNYNNRKWKSDKLNILIPMAGAGSRFEKAGYINPKPLIDVNGKPMIQVVVNNLNIDAHYHFIFQEQHQRKYNLDQMLKLIAPGCTYTMINGITEGAACTTLQAEEYINNDTPLIMANSDQYVEWNSDEFMYSMITSGVDAGILTFKATDPKWSFAKVDENGFVTEVAEKKPISDIATVGIYYWKKGSDYVKYAKQMIAKNIRVNNEFYVCPVFNEAIQDGKKVKIFNIEKMWGIGTPEDLTVFLNNKII